MTPLRPCNAIVNSCALPWLLRMEEKSYAETGDTSIFLEVNISKHVLKFFLTEVKHYRVHYFCSLSNNSVHESNNKGGWLWCGRIAWQGARNRLGRLRRVHVFIVRSSSSWRTISGRECLLAISRYGARALVFLSLWLRCEAVIAMFL